MAIVAAPNEIKANPKVSVQEALGGYVGSNWYKTVCPASGGVFAYYVDQPYPRRGHLYPEGCIANNVIKKLTIGTILTLANSAMAVPLLGFALLPFKFKLKIMERALYQYAQGADAVLRDHLLKYKFYNKLSRQLWRITFLLLRGLGISFDTSYRIGRIVANLFEYEDMYLLRMEDIFTASSKEAWLKNPRKELKRVAEIYKTREVQLGKYSVGEKFLSGFKLLSYLFYIPRFKKAFKNAMEQADFEDLKMEESDRYWMLGCNNGYNFMGREWEDRKAEHISIYNHYTLHRLKAAVKLMPDNPQAKENVISTLMEVGI